LHRAEKDIKGSLFPIGAGVVVGMVLSVSEIYDLLTQEQELREAIGRFASLTAGVLLLLGLIALSRRKKIALSLFASAITLVIVRWAFIDPSYSFTLPTLALLALFTWFNFRIYTWVRAGALR